MHCCQRYSMHWG
jgi:hypothetical protein